MKIFTFSSSLKTIFNKSWHKASFGNGDSSFIQIQGSDRFPREDNNKIGRGNTLTLFLKSYLYNQLSPNISQIILQWREFMFVQIDNTLFQTKMIEKWRKYMNDLLKIIHWRIMGTVSTKLGLESSLDKGNSNEGSCLFPGTCILKG